jgi:hypothetical protein
MDVWYAQIDIENLVQRHLARITATQRKRAERTLAKARTKDSLTAFEKLTHVVDGERQIVNDPPLIVRADDLAPSEERQRLHDEMRDLIRGYRLTLPRDRRRLVERYRLVDAARKVVGVGSVGTRAWIFLLLGRDGDDPLFMQAKEAQASVLEPFVGKSEFANHGQRVVEGQRLMQGASDIMLGWLHTTGLDGAERDFYIRQLWDSKGGVTVEEMQPEGMVAYGELCGYALAKAHARSGDPVAIASYLGTGDGFDGALDAFAEVYADQNERDYDALKRAAAAGRVKVETGL